MSIGGFIRRHIFWTYDFFLGSPIRSHYNDIKHILTKDNSRSRIRQQKHLDNILFHATKHCAFYENFTGMKINEFPVVNKAIYLSQSDNFKIETSKIPFHKGKMHIQRTSGSTGTPLAVPQDFRKRNRRLAELKYFGEIAGYKSHDKLAQLRIWTRWQKKSKWQIFKENIFAVNCKNMNEETLNFLCSLIKKKNIEAILGYASWFDHLAGYLERNKIELNSIKTIITTSEMLQDHTRLKLRKLIGCKVISRYSNEEMGILGQQFDKSSCYYLNHASYYFELLKLESDEIADIGEVGRIVVTDLFNYAFPMIRYDTGDTGIMTAGNQLSNELPILNKIFGRRIDLIYDTKGNPVHPMSLARILKNYTNILQWQFIQNSKKEYLLKLNLKDSSIINDCVSELKSIFGQDSIIELEYVNEIPVLDSGKRKAVICNYKK